MAQGLKGLLCKQKDQHLDPQNHIMLAGCGSLLQILVSEGRDMRRSLEQVDYQDKLSQDLWV